MQKQITRISPHQSSKTMAALYVIFTLPLTVIGLCIFLFGSSPQTLFPVKLFIFAPIIYGVFGYIFFAIFCWLYNIVAKRIGGFEFVVTDIA